MQACRSMGGCRENHSPPPREWQARVNKSIQEEKVGLTSTRKSNWWTDRTSPQRFTRYLKGVKVESMR